MTHTRRADSLGLSARVLTLCARAEPLTLCARVAVRGLYAGTDRGYSTGVVRGSRIQLKSCIRILSADTVCILVSPGRKESRTELRRAV